MELFNIIAGVASILSLIITVFVASKVVKICTSFNIDNSNNLGKQVVKGDNNKVAGRDSR